MDHGECRFEANPQERQLIVSLILIDQKDFVLKFQNLSNHSLRALELYIPNTKWYFGNNSLWCTFSNFVKQVCQFKQFLVVSGVKIIQIHIKVHQ